MSSMICPCCQWTLDAAAHFCSRCGQNLSEPVSESWVIKGIDLRTVARRQRQLLWYVLANLVCGALAFNVMSLGAVEAIGLLVVIFAVQIFIVVGTVQLLAALREPLWMRIVYGIFLLLGSCIGVLFLLIANRHATRALRDAGLRVGFMGVPDAQVVTLLSRFNCRQCGYSLVGNTSGRCPECGTPSHLAAMPVPPAALQGGA